jgi:hypothetical protein
MVTENEIKEVFLLLRTRELNPKGKFDKAGRFYLDHADLVDVRDPSRAFPYSQLVAGRTLKYVKKVVEKFNPQSKDELLKLV